MRHHGSSIRIFLTDGTVTGIKIAELVNKTIQSISCPRRRIAELSQLDESQKPGVYLLFGEDDVVGGNKVYIGESENVYSRLQHHVANKEFWNEAIFFVSKDENLTKAHIRYLESRLVHTARSTNRYIVDNSNEPQPSPLPRADKAAMEEFLIYIKLLEEVTTQRKPNVQTSKPISYEQQELKLYLNYGGVAARALQTDEGIVVLKGSEAIKEPKTSLSYGYRKLREKLINDGTLKLKGDKYIFQRDVIFNTASPAAAIVVATSISGPQNWKNDTGKTLKEIEEDLVEKSNS